MTNKQESALSLVAAMFVLFSAMLDPVISVVVSLIALFSFSIYKYLHPKK